jgi:hypothetical protein
MGLFGRGSGPDPGEVKAFGRGRQASARAAAAHAQQARDRAATRRAGNLAAQRERHLKAQEAAKGKRDG